MRDKLIDADMYMENLPAIDGATKQHELEKKIKFVKDKANPFGTVGQVMLILLRRRMVSGLRATSRA